MNLMTPWLWTALLGVPLAVAIGLAGRAWELTSLTLVLLVGLGTLVATVPVVVDEVHRSQRRR
jgi:hypothetical protein